MEDGKDYVVYKRFEVHNRETNLEKTEASWNSNKLY